MRVTCRARARAGVRGRVEEPFARCARRSARRTPRLSLSPWTVCIGEVTAAAAGGGARAGREHERAGACASKSAPRTARDAPRGAPPARAASFPPAAEPRWLMGGQDGASGKGNFREGSEKGKKRERVHQNVSKRGRGPKRAWLGSSRGFWLPKKHGLLPKRKRPCLGGGWLPEWDG